MTGVSSGPQTLPAPEPCDVCGAAERMRFELAVSLVGGLDTSVCRCDRCGFRQVRPRLTTRELERLYTGAYFDSGSGYGFRDYALQQQRNERRAYFLVKRLERNARTGRLLEVGCAVGFLLEAVRRFSAWDVTGIDVSPFAVAYARRRYGLKVECSTLESAGFRADSFDFVVQHSILEHVTHPREHLRETLRILKPGGQLWIITPNGEANLRPFRSLAGRLRARSDPALPLIDEGHLQFFSRDNLLQLFADCGFECLWLKSIGIRRGLRNLGYLPGGRHPLTAGAQGQSRVPSAAAAGHRAARDDEEITRQCDRLESEVAARHTRIRSSTPYFYFRHALHGFDGLPGSLGLGSDFSCLLRKPI